ncbi:uncharacterized protein KQ657_001995 [Scheffersomyces spartinae]|uniref:Histone-binding protein RBBP4-like N-terminal domain-containing protein n=1 Tax=Scheffersomyces spartinae TaxID=45513 RepID=A0A9P7V7E0_9ASCO|nr:uncharacterized protein KQ657_001995 [Scheffersomyces spartinae]KAG7192276.1 hypothetical protein KQ657_001995 [Scheffersomyces spartinae]
MTIEELQVVKSDNDALEVEDDGGSNSPIDTEIQTKYRIWKKNTPYLYNYISTNSLLWPSLSVLFFPDAETKVPDSEPWETLNQRLLVGTFTLGQGKDSLSVYKHSYYPNLKSNLNMNSLSYNSEKEEFEVDRVSKKKLQLVQSISHLGDVNKTRYMPQNPDVIASANNLGDLVIYDRTKHSSFQSSLSKDSITAPELRLVSSSTAEKSVDMFALDWNHQKEGSIVSATTDGHVSIYDIQHDITSEDTSEIREWLHIDNSEVGVNDIQWLPHHDSLFIYGDEQGYIKLADTRSSEHIVKRHQMSSKQAINSVSICCLNSLFIGTGDAQGAIHTWDLRTLHDTNTVPLHTINAHSQSVTQLKWHPKFHNCLGSSSSDGTVKLFALNNHHQMNQGLQFIHAGHMLGVNDFDWSLHDDWMIASVSDDNSLHVWKPAVKDKVFT